MNKKKNILWPLDNKCPYNCKYCYLRFDEKSNPVSCTKNNNEMAVLNALDFKQVDKIFLAGAEPLANEKIFDIIKVLRDKNVKTILCTNGILLKENMKKITDSLSAVSISLDSSTPEYTDYYRNKESWKKIVDSTQALKEKLIKNKSKTKIGIYMVVSHKNVEDVFQMFKLCQKLNLDYFIYQPITLQKQHYLYKELVLTRKDISILKKQIENIAKADINIYVPNQKYNELMFDSLLSKRERRCFIDNDFLFLLPDGSFSACPVKSSLEKRNIYKDADYNFPCVENCKCFSEECSNIFQLLCFDEVLNYDKK